MHGRVPSAFIAVLVCAVTLMSGVCTSDAQVAISELMAVNSETLADEDGDYPDWIELHNPGDAAVHLGGWSLTDDPRNFTRWTFPGLTLPAGEFLVVFASGKDRRDPASELHTNFRLSSSGEYLALIEPDGVTVAHAYVPRFPDQDVNGHDVSYGLTMADGEAGLRYFTAPTPGASNGEGFEGVVSDLQLSHTRDFYEQPLLLTILTETEGAEIRYTTDGSIPTEIHGNIYLGPVPITTTTPLRAAAFREGYIPSGIETRTFIFLDDVIRQPAYPEGFPSNWRGRTHGDPALADYGMDPEIVAGNEETLKQSLRSVPTLSLVTDMDNLFDFDTGIYANSWQDGAEWERPVSAELFDTSSSENLQIDCGLRIQGGMSRVPDRSPKHAFRLLFKREYGPGKLRFPLFGPAYPEGGVTESFDTIVLRIKYNNSWTHWSSEQRGRAQYIRDQYARDCQLAMGHASAHGRFVHLYLNGLYWGLYNPSERPTAPFLAEYFGGEAEDYDALNSGEVRDGDRTAWSEMMRLATRTNLSIDANYEAVKAYLDVENLIDYVILNHYLGNNDWDDHNWYSGRKRELGAGYRFFCWDTERILEGVAENKIGVNLGGKPSGLFHQLRASDEFVMLFADRVHLHFFNRGALTPEIAGARYAALADRVDLAVYGESARWGDYRRSRPFRHSEWEREKQRRLESYFPVRTNNVLQQYRNARLYPNVDAPEFNKHGGMIPQGFQLVVTSHETDSPTGVPTPVYYALDGSDPRLPGGAVNTESAALYDGPLTLTESVHVKARALDGDTWSALTEAAFIVGTSGVLTLREHLKVSEILYDPPDGDELEFLELHNSSSSLALDLSGAVFTDGIDFTFPDGVTIAPGGYLLMTRAGIPAGFRDAYSLDRSVAVIGPYTGKLSNGGERITLRAAADGAKIFDFEYADRRGWPVAADGAGHSLVPLEAAMDAQDSGSLDYGGNWRASTYRGGSPGREDPRPLAAVLLNEIKANTATNTSTPPGYNGNDWIELTNTTSLDVFLADWYLSDDDDDLKKWAIPDTIIAGHGHVVFDETTGFHASITEGFGLDRDGERVYLSHFPGNGEDRVADAVRFKAQELETSLGRYPDGADDGYALPPSPGAANLEPVPHIVISELMYHPPPRTDGFGGGMYTEYIELLNTTGQDVDLWNSTGPWRIDGGVEYVFPEATTLPPRASLLIVDFDPGVTEDLTAFREDHGIVEDTQIILGPFEGKLSDNGERVALERPLTPSASDDTAWVIVDEAIYFDQAPFPSSADGEGHALHRISPNRSGNVPSNWMADEPAPGVLRDVRVEKWQLH